MNFDEFNDESEISIYYASIVYGVIEDQAMQNVAGAFC